MSGSESAAADNSGALSLLEETDWRYSYGQRRADALARIFSIAPAHADDGHAVGSDRYLAEGNANGNVGFRRRSDHSAVGVSSPPAVSASLFRTG